MVSRHNHQRIAIFACKRQCFLHRFIQIDGFTNLTTRVGSMVLLIDRGPFHLQEEAFLLTVQQGNRFLRHLRQCRG
ncbi:hypothetical protein D3C87_2037910 [compost metagenome]